MPRLCIPRSFSIGILAIASHFGFESTIAQAGKNFAPSDSIAGDAPSSTVLKFDDKGAQVGEQLPDLTLYTLDGEPVSSRFIWGNLPFVCVTSSLTCPKSREAYPKVAELARSLGEKHPVVIIYVIEAHPKGDISPYRGREDVTRENLRDGILYRQPATLEERLKLAREFKKRLNVDAEIYVDGMENAAWEHLGGGPNMGVLVGDGSRVLARQGWFNKPAMEEAVAALAKPGAPRTSVNGAATAALAPAVRPYDWNLLKPFREGDVARAEEILKSDPSMLKGADGYSARGREGGRTLVQYATEGKQRQIIELLAGRGADVNAQTIHYPSPLHIASKLGDKELVSLLLKLRANVNLTAPAGPTPLQEALIYNHADIADLLIKAGAKPNFFTDVAMGNVQAMNVRLASDSSVAGRPDGWNRNPLEYAAATGQLAAMKRLIASGASDRLAPGSTGDTALHRAVRNNQPAAALLLLDKGGGDANATSGWSETPLHLAAAAGTAEVAQILLDHKANIAAEDLRGWQPIHIAARDGQGRLIELLIYAGASPDAPTGVPHLPCGPGDEKSDLDTPLHIAVMNVQPAAVRALIARGANVNAVNASSETPLHLLHLENPENEKGRLEIKGLLLEHGAVANVREIKSPHVPLNSVK